ncbi:MAG: hypothetical protein LUH47_05735, partial [Clostridiales bacterium]|nr:hypothetical protein [Clostridiales bacterium]
DRNVTLKELTDYLRKRVNVLLIIAMAYDSDSGNDSKSSKKSSDEDSVLTQTVVSYPENDNTILFTYD